ncbi:MAG: hypothetical protein NVS3B17_16000 [Vulcanimicrobiaceae bacterium]
MLAAEHPRSLRWIGTTALAVGGGNRSLFLLPALLIGQGAMSGQGTAAVPLLFVGLLLSWAALPGWIELVLLSPNRVGGIAAACVDAYKPYSPVISAIVGCCYWWGWVPACGWGAIVAASALHASLFPSVPTELVAVAIVATFYGVNLCGIAATTRVAIPLGIATGVASFFAIVLPLWTGRVDWHLATTFTLTTPFAGWFGSATSLMAGLYLIGFAAPAFEAAACHVGETIDPARNVPRAMVASAVIAGFYFIVVPLVLLGLLGPVSLGGALATELGPALAPIFGSLAKAVAIGFVVTNMLLGALQPLAGASRTLAQLAEDGLVPRSFARRSPRDVPWVATTFTALAAIAFLAAGEPLWLIAAANFTYLIAIALASGAVFILRRRAPDLPRPYRAPAGTLALGLVAASLWIASAVLGFQQFGVATVMLGLAFAFMGAAFYAWRRIADHRLAGGRGIPRSLHLRLASLMTAVLAFDGAGYFFAIRSISRGDAALVTALQDIFVTVAIVTIAIGVSLPSMIAQAATSELADINVALTRGTMALEAEIAVRKEAEQQLSHLAFHDELTGLGNRASFTERLAQTIARVHRFPDRFAAVIFLDLDRFKIVNDSLGHLAGDQLLVAVAKRLASTLRPGDALARLGGDEFTFLIDDLGSDPEASALAFAEGVLEALAAPFEVFTSDIFVSASIGIAIARTGRKASDDLLRDADIAMYRAKDAGRHRCMLFAPEFLERAVGELQMESDLKGALERDEFVLFYQPIVALATGELVGFEALIRWQHPERGLLTPDAFIGAAEASDIICAIGAFVLEEAARQARLWRDRFGEERRLAISVNVSARQFARPKLLNEIRGALSMYDLGPEYLHIEITESAIMVNPEMATATLSQLRALGIDVHLDDFGTGYSSLGYLQRFPVSTLKIDRSFVSVDDGRGIGNRQIVETIASLARSLDIETTAEGIETREQLAALRALGCTNGQGYFFSRPMNAMAATVAIETWTHAIEASEAAGVLV